MKRLVLALVGAAVSLACSPVPEDARIGVNAPDFTQFAPVSDYLDHRCGSLDCHGSASRNLAIFGCSGLRLDPNDAPGCRRDNGNKDTTSVEYQATYRSIVGLEPAVMSVVVAGKGAHPELLSLIRKGRGDDAHKGGSLLIPGDDQEKCIISWLAGSTDQGACTSALSAP